MQINQVQEQINSYETFMKSIGQFEGVEVSDYRRKELSGLLKRYVTYKELFIRNDKQEDDRNVIELHVCPLSYGMDSAVTIYIVDNKFQICDDRLIATLEGLYEHLSELKLC